MNEIQSKCPRTFDGEVTVCDLDKLNRIARDGPVYASILAIIGLIWKIKPMILSLLDFHSTLDQVIAWLVASTMILLSFAIGRWLYASHRIVCLLRSLEPKIPSRILAILCGIAKFCACYR